MKHQKHCYYWLVSALVLLLAVGLTACAGGQPAPTQAPAVTKAPVAQPTVAQPPAPTQAAAVKPAATQAPAASAGAKVKKVAIVIPASRTDHGWNQQGADNLTSVGKELGITAEVAENQGYGDITPVLRDLQDKGFDLIICHASGYQTVCPEFAKKTKVKVAAIENQAAVTPGLISDIETQAQEAAYLAGVLAGKMTKSGTVGVVTSGEPPTWNYMTVGFAEGLKATKPDAKFLYSVIGEAAYEDAAGAKRVTASELAAGADIIFGMGDGASFGMVQAVEEHNAKGGAKAWFIDVIGDKRDIDKSKLLLSSVLFDYSGIYKQMIKDVEAGTFGKVYTMDVKNNGVHLLDLPPGVPADVADAVQKAKAEIVADKLKVSAISDSQKMRARINELFPKR
ncbi:MAG: BMP family protein [Chloroflexi bacterium]|nr:BMP family protein [Chloroflexota bacterium]MDA8187962.1 BMP family protein [Dehalococcoidales bacterium]